MSSSTIIESTVVISNYNYGRYIEAAVDSCLDQTVLCKIIVVDDVSTDESWTILQNYRNDSNVTLVRLKKNSGGNARGKNVGIALTKTKYVTCLDSDDMLVPDSIEQRMNFDGVDFVHGWTHHVRSHDGYEDIKKNESLKKPWRKNARYQKLAHEIGSPRWAWAIQGNTVLAKMELYEKFGLYDEEMKWKVAREMWYRWLSHGATVRTVDRFVAIYRKHGKNITILSAKNRGPKDAKLVTAMLNRRKEERKKITKDNTTLLTFYDPMVYLSEML